MKIPVAHDFICPWCWVALSQANKLKREFDVEFEWLSYELYPDELDWPVPSPPTVNLDRPPRPSRLELAYRLEDLAYPGAPRPVHMRSHHAHEAVEFARTVGAEEILIERFYRALFLDGRDINDPNAIAELSAGIVDDVPGMMRAIEERRFADRIVGFDDAANARGVYGVPTFWIAGERYLEQPYSVLRSAVAVVATAESFYTDLNLPEAPPDRPYVLIDMVATIDGKTESGAPGESVLDLGSKEDHEALHRIERQVDAVLIGGGTLRASPGTWRPRTAGRIVVSHSGDLPWKSAFLNEDVDRRIVLKPAEATFAVPQGFACLEVGRSTVDLRESLRLLRLHHGVARLLVEGGSELNAQLLSEGLVDELFLTIAPKVKLGRGTKTYAGGEPLPRESMKQFELVEQHRVGDEVFLRYRRR